MCARDSVQAQAAVQAAVQTAVVVFDASSCERWHRGQRRYCVGVAMVVVTEVRRG